MFQWLTGRPTSEAMVLIFVVTVCASVFVVGLGLLLTLLLNPNRNLDAYGWYSDLLSTMLGAALGLLGGRVLPRDQPK